MNKKNEIPFEIGFSFEMPLAVFSWGIILAIAAYLIEITQSIESSYLLIIIYSLIIFGYTYRKNSNLRDSYKWPMHKAKYINSIIIKRACFGHWPGYSKKKIFNDLETKAYYPKIKYVYEIDDVKIESENMFLLNCNLYDSYEDSIKIKNSLVENKMLKVYVNPNNQYQSILIKGEDKRYEMSYIVPLLMAASQFLILSQLN